MSIGVIDKSFLAVERAMPFGYALTRLGWLNGVWVAEVRPVSVRGFRLNREMNGTKRMRPIQADGVTPQEAMNNLADVLDSFRENTKTRRKHDAVDAIIAAVFGAPQEAA